MPSSARGVHLHPQRKLGKAPPVDKPKLKLSRLLTGVLPAHPVGVDNLAGVPGFGLDSNDKYGVCVPTGYDNLRRMTTTHLAGVTKVASQDQIFSWYRTQNPQFDPIHYDEAHDQGMVIQDFLSYLVKTGEIVAFAAVDHTEPEEMNAALYLFLGLMLGVDLEVAQQAQSDARPAVWDYAASGDWGGHCIAGGAYDSGGLDIVTWAERVRMTRAFMTQQLDEAWVVIRQEHLDNPTFRQGINLAALTEGFEQLTGRELPLPVPPTNPPVSPVAPSQQLVVNLTDPEIIRHITHVSKSSSVDEWAAHHFRSYFRIK